jgi:hypothetical protein
LTNAVETVHLPPLIIMHHIIVLSPLRLPHEAQGWSEQEYFAWIQKHPDEREQWDLLEKAVDGQVVRSEASNGDKGETRDTADEEAESVRILKEVLEHARCRDE